MEPPVSSRPLLEVAIASVEDARVAEAGGADRLELNVALNLGGLTPSLGLLEGVKAVSRLPVMVMIRPRSGGFAYSPDEFAVMLRDLELAVEGGADGVVFGVLQPDGRIDRERCRRLLDRAGPAEPVFHRAFDVTPDPTEALEHLIALGFRRVMTSGQQETAYNGASRIAAFRLQGAGRVEILPAGGINSFTIVDVLARTGCDQVHAALRSRRRDSSTSARPAIGFGSPVRSPEDQYDATDPQAVATLRDLLDRDRANPG
jgi:copper homeostasis protein